MNENTIKLAYVSIRHLLFKHAIVNFKKIPQPANLKYLADHLSSSELRDVYKNIPADAVFHILERNQRRLWRNVNEGAYGSLHENSRFRDFVREFRALPSGYCPPSRDGHFVGAEISFDGASTEDLIAFMKFFSDERFVKPPFSSAVGIRLQLPIAVDTPLSHAVAKTLNDSSEVKWPIAPARVASYLAALASESHSSLTASIVTSEEQMLSDVQTVRVLLQVTKNAAADQLDRFSAPQTDLMEDSIRIGQVYLPAGKRPPLRPHRARKVQAGSLRTKRSSSINPRKALPTNAR